MQTLQSMQTGNSDKKPRTLVDILESPTMANKLQAVASQFMTPDRFLALAVNAVRKTPNLAKCDQLSVLGCFMTAASLGLEPNTVLQQAYLIPYKKWNPDRAAPEVYECQFQIGYRGFVTLAGRSRDIIHIEAEAIHENDLFENMQGSEAFLKYQKSLKDRGALIGSYCYTRHANSDEKSTTLPLDEILKIRSKSETYNSLLRNIEYAKNDKDKAKAQKKLDDTPWVLWEDDMAAKSAIKKHAKQLDFSEDHKMRAAVEVDSDHNGYVIDMAAMSDPDVVNDVMSGKEDAPTLEHQPGETLDMTANFIKPAQQEAVQQEAEPAPRQARHRREDPPVQQQAPQQGSLADDNFSIE